MKITAKQKGMTLVEIMVAATIGLIVVTSGLSFVIQTLKTYQYETGKLLINKDIRKFTAQMVDDGTYADSFQIYDQMGNLSRSSYTAVGSTDPTAATYQGYTADLTVTAPADPVSTSTPGTQAVASGLPGDEVVYVYNLNGDSTVIYQLVVYYRVNSTPAGGTTGTNAPTANARVCGLYRLVVSIPAAVQSAGIMKLLPEITAATKGTLIFPYVDGQANDVIPTGSTNRSNKIFYNLNNTSILVRARIYENYTAQRIVKSTYNFTVKPRG